MNGISYSIKLFIEANMLLQFLSPASISTAQFNFFTIDFCFKGNKKKTLPSYAKVFREQYNC